MRSSCYSSLRILALGLILLQVFVLPAFAAPTEREQKRLDRRGEKLAASVRDIQSLERSQIPADIMRQAKAVIVLKQYEAGVIFGASGGFGIVAKRDPEGYWGAPAWLKTGEISGGLQLGAQKLNVVLLVVKDRALEMLKKEKFQLGVDANIVRGPTGAYSESSIGQDADMLAYTAFEGYYAGASFEGGFLLPDNKANESSYGQKFEVTHIIEAPDLDTPDSLIELFELLDSIEVTGLER
ncbi:lipid-binding SYLF domain-containing protein [Pelagicoccus mobilis]|uniref:Lipid-binding SYLF domain-containing protein n=1 Tax=Pelagicoccus mobilis TaxID=415221 RepID=A0A934RS66_9BACT|nr:lipid-binding SYLF domain-containing protein [Pelagicoccus mobilis]MBK1876610.1 lipid-binding SYLF domain-containing protein [Pelagicoccus mobilis]